MNTLVVGQDHEVDVWLMWSIRKHLNTCVQHPAPFRKILVNNTVILKTSNCKRCLKVIEALFIRKNRLTLNIALKPRECSEGTPTWNNFYTKQLRIKKKQNIQTLNTKKMAEKLAKSVWNNNYYGQFLHFLCPHFFGFSISYHFRLRKYLNQKSPKQTGTLKK